MGKRNAGKVVKKEHIYVGIPCGPMITPGIANFNGALQKLSMDPRSRFVFTVNFKMNVRPADFARNSIVQDFLESDATRLWFVDSDLLPSDNCVRVILPDVDIVGGLYAAFGMSVTGNNRVQPGEERPSDAHYVAYIEHESGGYVPAPRHERGLHRCDGIGTGMMSIKRRVLEDPRMRHHGEWDRFNGQRGVLTENDPPAIFLNRHKPNGQFDATEDLDFCWRAKRLGYSIAADHEVVCGHWKEGNVENIVKYGIKAFDTGFKTALEMVGGRRGPSPEENIVKGSWNMGESVLSIGGGR